MQCTSVWLLAFLLASCSLLQWPCQSNQDSKAAVGQQAAASGPRLYCCGRGGSWRAPRRAQHGCCTAQHARQRRALVPSHIGDGRLQRQISEGRCWLGNAQHGRLLMQTGQEHVAGQEWRGVLMQIGVRRIVSSGLIPLDVHAIRVHSGGRALLRSVPVKSLNPWPASGAGAALVTTRSTAAAHATTECAECDATEIPCHPGWFGKRSAAEAARQQGHSRTAAAGCGGSRRPSMAACMTAVIAVVTRANNRVARTLLRLHIGDGNLHIDAGLHATAAQDTEQKQASSGDQPEVWFSKNTFKTLHAPPTTPLLLGQPRRRLFCHASTAASRPSHRAATVPRPRLHPAAATRPPSPSLQTHICAHT